MASLQPPSPPPFPPLLPCMCGAFIDGARSNDTEACRKYEGRQSWAGPTGWVCRPLRDSRCAASDMERCDNANYSAPDFPPCGCSRFRNEALLESSHLCAKRRGAENTSLSAERHISQLLA